MNSKNVLIVGGSSSIGQGIVNKFLGVGANVISTYCQSLGKFNDHKSVVQKKLDLMSPESISNFCLNDIQSFEKIDVLVVLPAILPGKSLLNYDDQLIGQVMDLNFTKQAILIRRLLPNLIEGGSIVLMSSISAQRGSYDPIYAASKGALISFVKSLAVWHGSKLRINAIAPSLVDGSSMYKDMALERREFHIQQAPSGRLTSIADVAEIIFSMCQPEWSNLNGQVLSINGGSYV
jgi:3-oxoacyl-[acyl-carrier protein] reductase